MVLPYLHVTGDKFWGGKTFFADKNDIIASIEEQAKSNIDALVEFTKQYNKDQNLDGFCIEINDETARSKKLQPLQKNYQLCPSDFDDIGRKGSVNGVGNSLWQQPSITARYPKKGKQPWMAIPVFMAEIIL